MEKYSNTRPCTAPRRNKGTVPALFHGWSHVAEVAAPSLITGGHAGGQLCDTYAIVEYEDGTVARVPVHSVKFLDSYESFSIYDWVALSNINRERAKELDERYGK